MNRSKHYPHLLSVARPAVWLNELTFDNLHLSLSLVLQACDRTGIPVKPETKSKGNDTFPVTGLPPCTVLGVRKAFTHPVAARVIEEINQ